MTIRGKILIELEVNIDLTFEPGQRGCRDSMGAAEEPDIEPHFSIEGIFIDDSEFGNRKIGSKRLISGGKLSLLDSGGGGAEVLFDRLSKSEKEEVMDLIEREISN